MRPLGQRLLRQIAQAKTAVRRLAAFGIVGGLCSLLQAYAITQVIVSLVQHRSLLYPACMLIGSLGLRGVTTAVREHLVLRSAQEVSTAIRRQRLKIWLGSTVEERPDPATAHTLATEGVDAVEPYVARYLPALVTAAILPAIVVGALLLIDWVSALIVILTLPLLPVFGALIGGHTEQAVSRRFDESVLMAGHFADVVRGLPTLVGYQRAEKQADQVASVGDRHRRATVRTLRIAFLSSAALEFVGTLSVAVVAVAVGLRLAGGDITLETGLLAILLAPEAYWPIRRVGQEFHSAADGAQALDQLLDSGAEHRDSPIAPSTNHVRVSGLSYHYQALIAHDSEDVLRGVSFTARPGLTVLTGPSGCGKTTLLELLAGVRTPSAGQIEAPESHLVAQRPFLTPGTDVRLGGPHSRTVTVGDDGFGLSAGQKARAALDRAAASDARLILVDEPTAHLDREAANDFITTLTAIAHERIVIAVTHDPRLIEAADHRLALPTHTPNPTRSPESNSEDDNRHSAVLTQRTNAESGRVRRGVDGSGGRSPVRSEARGRATGWLSRRTLPGGAALQDSTRATSAAVALGTLATMSSVALTATSGWLIVRASEQPVILTLIVAIVLVRTFGVARPALRYAERLQSHDVALRQLVARRTEAYRSLIPLTPARLGRHRRADLLTNFVRDVDDVVEAQVRVRVPVRSAVLTGVLAMALSWWQYTPVGLVLLGQLLATGFATWCALRLERQDERVRVAARADLRRSIHLVTANIVDLQVISATQHALENVDTAAGACRARARGRVILAGLVPIFTAVASVAGALLLTVAVTAGSISPATAAMLALVPFAVGEVFDGLPDVVSAWARSDAAKGRVAQLLTQDPAVDDKGATPIRLVTGNLATNEPTVEWEPENPIHLPSLSIRRGEHVVATGPNGCGKSTLLAALARHLDTQVGAVYFDEQDVKSGPVDDVRRHIALVDDEPHVFAGSVRANLLLAQPNASDHQLQTALDRAGLQPWLRGLPQGLDTQVGGERALSGGERTRLAMARALLSERPVLLLDEPVAHLDQPRARQILTDLERHAQQQTVIVVSHQPVDFGERTIDMGASPRIEPYAVLVGDRRTG